MSTSTTDNAFPDLTELVGFRLRRAQLAYFKSFSAICTEHNVTPGLFGILASLQNHPGQTQTTIGQEIGTDRSGMAVAVDKLQKLGLVERKKSASDRRTHELYLTESGTELTNSLYRSVLLYEKHFEQVMNKGEKDWLLGMLERIIDLEQ